MDNFGSWGDRLLLDFLGIQECTQEAYDIMSSLAKCLTLTLGRPAVEARLPGQGGKIMCGCILMTHGRRTECGLVSA